VVAIILVRPGVTILAPADLYDCRPYGAWGQLTVPQANYLAAIDVDANSQVRDASTGNPYRYTGSAWVSAGAQWLWTLAPLPYSDSGFTTPGAGGQGLLNVLGPIPAHTPGTLRIRMSGLAISGANFGGTLYLGTSLTTSSPVPVPGTAVRVHPYNQAGHPIPFTCDGYLPSDGSARYVWLLGDTDASGSSFQVVQGSGSAYLL
jgi:hypothetical protein